MFTMDSGKMVQKMDGAYTKTEKSVINMQGNGRKIGGGVLDGSKQ